MSTQAIRGWNIVGLRFLPRVMGDEEPWVKGPNPDAWKYNFKGIRSNAKADDGTVIRSGQRVLYHGRIDGPQVVEVMFEPNYGFKINGNNLADAYVTEVISQPNALVALWGILRHTWFNLFG